MNSNYSQGDVCCFFLFFFIAAENTGPIFALCTRDRDIIIITTVEIILIYTK